MREAPPVSATMPSALGLIWTSWAGTRQMNHANPVASASAAPAQSKSPDLPIRRSKRRGAWGAGADCVIPPSSILVCAANIHFSSDLIMSIDFGGPVARGKAHFLVGGQTGWSIDEQPAARRQKCRQGSLRRVPANSLSYYLLN